MANLDGELLEEVSSEETEDFSFVDDSGQAVLYSTDDGISAQSDDISLDASESWEFTYTGTMRIGLPTDYKSYPPNEWLGKAPLPTTFFVSQYPASTSCYVYRTSGYLCFSKSVNILQSDYGTIQVSATLSNQLLAKFMNTLTLSGSGTSFDYYPIEVALLVNNEIIAPDSIFVSSGGHFRFDVEYALTDDISSLGFAFYYKGGSLSGGCSSWTYCGFETDLTISSCSIVGTSATYGLLRTIIEFLKSIVSGIVSLPDKIASAISDMLQSLFVPSEDDFESIQSQYEELLESKLGFVYQAASLITDFGTSVLSAFSSGAEYSFRFPGISVPIGGTTYTIVEASDVSMDNAFMDVVRPVIGTIVSIVAVVAFINTAERMLIAITSGVSYFQFLKGDGKDDN